MTAILGAGVSGLSAAYYALGNSKLAPIIVLEASNRVGGWIRSKEQEDGTIFEQGPRTIRPLGALGENTLQLVEQLGLSDKVTPIRIAHPAAQNRLIYADDQLHLLPNTVKGIFKKNTLLNRSLLGCIWKDLTTRKIPKDDESIYSFIERRFGEDVAEKMASTMICGICAGDAREISVKSLTKSMFEAEQKYGSVTRGLIIQKFFKNGNQKKVDRKGESKGDTKPEIYNATASLVKRARNERWAMWGLKGGLEQLPQALLAHITKHGVNLEMEHRVENLEFNKSNAILTVNGEDREYSRIISSLPAKKLADLVHKQHPKLSEELRSIPTVTVGVVNLQYSENVLPIDAFGVLIPPKEEIPILGVIFDSCVLPQSSKTTVLTVMMGGAWFDKYFGKCPMEGHLLSVATDHVQKILCIEEDPQVYNVSILKDCIPQHIVGHMQRLTRIHNYISTHKIPLGLCGSSYQGVGLNDVILSAKQAVSDINSHIL